MEKLLVKNMIVSGIYKMYWGNNDYTYYGQAVRLGYRFSSHKETLRKGKHRNPKVQSVYNKYGEPKFEILERCHVDHLDEREQYYIDQHFGNPNCCNINPLSTSSKGAKQSDETNEKNRVGHLGIFDGDKNPFYGRKHSVEARIKISKKKLVKNSQNLVWLVLVELYPTKHEIRCLKKGNIIRIRRNWLWILKQGLFIHVQKRFLTYIT